MAEPQSLNPPENHPVVAGDGNHTNPAVETNPPMPGQDHPANPAGDSDPTNPAVHSHPCVAGEETHPATAGEGHTANPAVEAHTVGAGEIDPVRRAVLTDLANPVGVQGNPTADSAVHTADPTGPTKDTAGPGTGDVPPTQDQDTTVIAIANTTATYLTGAAG